MGLPIGYVFVPTPEVGPARPHRLRKTDFEHGQRVQVDQVIGETIVGNSGLRFLLHGLA